MMTTRRSAIRGQIKEKEDRNNEKLEVRPRMRTMADRKKRHSSTEAANEDSPHGSRKGEGFETHDAHGRRGHRKRVRISKTTTTFNYSAELSSDSADLGHLSRKKKRNATKVPSGEDADEGGDEKVFEVEAIVGRRLQHVQKGGAIEVTTLYLVKWAGYNKAYNKWEPAQNLNCPQLVESFEATLGNTGAGSSRQKPGTGHKSAVAESGRGRKGRKTQ